MKNIKKIFVVGILFFTPLLYAAEHPPSPPDYAAIEQTIKNPNTSLYFPKLLKRLKRFDETFTQNEFKHLYYGYTFQKDYKPYIPFKKMPEIAQYSKKKMSPQEHKIALSLANEALEKNLFDTNALLLLMHVYTENGDARKLKAVKKIFQDILKTVISTGTGINCQSAFHVNYIDHEYKILEAMGVSVEFQALIGQCDYIEFGEGGNKVNIKGKPVKGLYFNISRMQDTFSVDQFDELIKNIPTKK